jgi:hypothetical protein
MILGPDTQQALERALMEKYGQVIASDPHAFIKDGQWEKYREFIKDDQPLLDKFGLTISNGEFILKKSLNIAKEEFSACPICGQHEKVMNQKDVRSMIVHGCCELCFRKHKQ